MSDLQILYLGRVMRDCDELLRVLEARHAADRRAMARDLASQGASAIASASELEKFQAEWDAAMATTRPMLEAAFKFCEDDLGTVQ
jgi:hypothetical protein